MKHLHLLAAAVLLASPAVAFAADCNEIPGVPATISVPGKYCLASDFTLNSTTAKAITINANDVTLDCRGHLLKNASTSNAGTSTGIYLSGRNNVVIQNCRVGGFHIGIDAFQNNAVADTNYYIQILDNVILRSYWHGIRAYGSGIEIGGNTVADTGLQLNQYAIGIRVGGSNLGDKAHIVRDNVVGGTYSPYSHAHGIFSDGSSSSTFLNNKVVLTQAAPGKLGYGIYVIGQLNRISDNHITSVGAVGETAIFATDNTTSCFDNYLRATKWTQNCDATYGNY